MVKLGPFLTGHTVTMVTCYVEKNTITCSKCSGMFMTPLLFYQVMKSGSVNRSKCKCCKVTKTRASRLNYLALTVGLKIILFRIYIPFYMF